MKGYVNNCGKLNLKTGKNAHFNVLEDWDESSTLTVFRSQYGTDIRVVGGCSICNAGDTLELLGSQNHRSMGFWVAVANYPNTKDGLAKIAGEINSTRVKFGTWD